jgi:hypothetical protein
MGAALRLETRAGHKILFVDVRGKLSQEDYEHFVPEVEQQIREQGKVRLLFAMRDFHGWEAGALWEDIKFDFKHHADIERLAIVGEKKWEQWMASFCKPFTGAEIRYFDHYEMKAAEEWITAG